MIDANASNQLVVERLRGHARRDLAAGDLLSAMQLAAEALKLAPLDPQACSLIDEISRVSEAPLNLAPQVRGSSALALSAARLRILFFLDRPAEALAYFCRVAPFAPTLALFSVLGQALTPAFVTTVGLTGLRPLITSLTEYALPVSVPAELDDPRLLNIGITAATLTTIRAQYPDQRELYAAEVLVRRRLRDSEGTLAVATLGVQRFPESWLCLTALAHALGDANRPDEAAVYARRALESSSD